MTITTTITTEAETKKPQWQRDLERDGFCVVPGVVDSASCRAFEESAWAWLEEFGYGFNFSDRSTWRSECLPSSAFGGLYYQHSVQHEAFVWAIRTCVPLLFIPNNRHPGIRRVFEQLWGTSDLIASFDGINVSFPLGPGRQEDVEPTKPWPHIDSDPRAPFSLYQGIANLAPNGPDDGGLCVLRGSHLLHPEYPGGYAGPETDARLFTEEEFAWYQSKCEMVKVCAGAGDLILWDSRTVHWNCSPTGEQPRLATYVCFCPRSMANEEAMERRLKLWEERMGSTHAPHKGLMAREQEEPPKRPDGSEGAWRRRPKTDVQETPEVLALVGLRP